MPHVSSRQEEVLQLLERGHTDKEIAAELKVGYRTVRTHLESLYRRFGVSTRTGLITAWRRPELMETSPESTPSDPECDAR